MRSELGNIRKLGPGSYRVEVSFGRDAVTGEPRRSSRNVRGTKADAKRMAARMALEMGAAPSSTMTLSEYLEEMWLPATRERVRTRTATDYELKLKKHVTPRLGHLRLDSLAPYQLDRWLGELAAGDLSPRSRLHCYRVLHNALSQAVRWRLIPSNPLDAVERPKVEQSDPDVLSASEANTYLDAFTGHPIEPFIVVAIAAGLRRSELAALRWSDVDLKTGVVSVSRGLHEAGGKVWAEDPKTARSRRTVVLPAWAVARLKKLRGLGPLVTEDDGPMRPLRISALYRKHVDATEGLRYIPLKNLRHTSASLALAAGVDLVSVSRRLGHSTVTTTDTFYLRPGRQADEIAAEKMDGFRAAK